MLKPSVGEISLMSSPLNFLMMVVLPALSRPSTSRRISFSFYLAFLTIDMNPIFINIWICIGLAFKPNTYQKLFFRRKGGIGTVRGFLMMVIGCRYQYYWVVGISIIRWVLCCRIMNCLCIDQDYHFQLPPSFIPLVVELSTPFLSELELH